MLYVRLCFNLPSIDQFHMKLNTDLDLICWEYLTYIATTCSRLNRRWQDSRSVSYQGIYDDAVVSVPEVFNTASGNCKVPLGFTFVTLSKSHHKA